MTIQQTRNRFVCVYGNPGHERTAMSFELPVADACTERDVLPACNVSRIKSKSDNLSLKGRQSLYE